MARFNRLHVRKLIADQIVQRNGIYQVDVGRQAYGFVTAGLQTLKSGSATQYLTSTAPIESTDYVLGSVGASDDTDTLNSINIDGNEVKAVMSADPLAAHSLYYAVAAANARPEYAVWAAGEATTVGGDATETITVTGALATDILLIQVGTSPATNNRQIVEAIVSANTITVVLSDDPSTTHTIQYALLRRNNGSFDPSHEIYTCAGPTTTTADATGRATNDLTVSGLRTTDLCFHSIGTASGAIQVDGSDRSTAGTVTVGFSADPSTTNTFRTVVLRAVQQL
jgi:hypothetical protein